MNRYFTRAVIYALLLVGILALLFILHREYNALRQRRSGAPPIQRLPRETTAARPMLTPVPPTGTTPARNTAPVPAPPATGNDTVTRLPEVIEGEHLFTFYDAHDQQAFLAVARDAGATILGTLKVGHAVHIRVTDPGQLERILTLSPRPTESGPNIRMATPPLPDRNPKRPDKTGYIGFGDKALRWLGVPKDNATWGKGITVAVLDSGSVPHKAIRGDRVTRLDVSGQGPTSATSDPNHANAVISIIAGSDSELSGVSPAVRILDVRVTRDDTQSDSFTLARGIVEAVDAGADIINICLGSRTRSFVLERAVGYATARGITIVASAGNDAVEGVSYPAHYNSVVAVAAVDAVGRHAYFSNRGSEISLAAPGISVSAAAPQDGVMPFSGTSAAAPFVSGAIAGLMSLEDISGSDAVALLRRYANDTGAPGPDPETGSGVPDLERVLNRDTPGIFDIACGTPLLLPATTDMPPTMQFTVQNQGTESIDTVMLRATVGSVSREVFFGNLAVGATAAHRVALPGTDPANPATVRFEAIASMPGVADARPGNNLRRGTISVSAL